MNFSGAIVSAYKNILNYDIRSSRSEYWWFVLFAGVASALIIGGAVIAISSQYVGNTELTVEFTRSMLLGVSGSLLLVFFVFGIPLLSLTIRRLHDIGQSGLWAVAQFGLSAALYVVSLNPILQAMAGDITQLEQRVEALNQNALITAMSLLLNVLQIVIFVMAIVPGQPAPNKYGPPISR